MSSGPVTGAAGAFTEAELHPAQFAEISSVVAEIAGIQLRDGKEGLVRSRLARRLRQLGLASYDAYLERVRADATGRERAEMLDLLTTNKTSFFREPAHFDALCDDVIPAFAAGRPPGGLRIWSAGCSTGEEPYTIAMVLREAIPELARGGELPRVLATDLSHRVLAAAERGVYADLQAGDVPPGLRERYFAPAPGGAWAAAAPLRALVRFARLNLMERWPMRGPFHAIFCRNVMIYFDKPTQAALVARFHALLAPGGYLFVGHSESLTGLAHDFAYVRPATYRKRPA